jgi:hypothetical protein
MVLASLVVVGTLVAAESALASHFVVYRINAGGAAIEVDGEKTWAADTAATSKFRNAAPTAVFNKANDPTAVDMSDAGGAPELLFKTHRYDVNDVGGEAHMAWKFPVPPGEYLVRLFFAETSNFTNCSDNPDKRRVFDVKIEGTTVLDNYEPSVAAGGTWTAVTEEFSPITRGALPNTTAIDILFNRQPPAVACNNPMISGIEIVNLDDTPPTATAPGEGFAAATRLGTQTVPVKASWSGSDNAGIARYELRRNGGAPFKTPNTSAIRPVSPGGPHQFGVTAFDFAQNSSPEALGDPFSVLVANETSSGFTYTGSWTRTSLTGARGGFVRQSSTRGARATFSFTGEDVALVSTKGPNRGKAAIFVDGVNRGTINLYARSLVTRSVVFAMNELGAGPHTLQVRVLGTKDARSSGKRVDVDAVVRTS